MVVAIALELDCAIYIVDVQTVFLNIDVEEGSFCQDAPRIRAQRPGWSFLSDET